MLDRVDYRALFGHLPTAFLVMDRDLLVLEVNPAGEQLLGRSRDELVGRFAPDAFPRTSAAGSAAGASAVRVSCERARDTGTPDVVPLQEYDVADPATGEVTARFWSWVSTPVLDDVGRVFLVLQQVADITEDVRARRAAEEAVALAGQALRASEQRARAVLDTAVDGIILIDGHGRVESVNKAAEAMFGYPADEVVGRNVSMLMPEPYRGEHDGYMERYRAGGEARIIGIGREVAGQRRDGSTFPLELAVSEVGEGRSLFAGVVRDITERKSLEAELVQQALYDALTGLANRRLLLERLDLAVSRRRRHTGHLALIFIDLDRFKRVNDTLGHEAGDQLLVHTADRLRAVVRPEDLVARLGGDEFVVLCEDLTGPAGAHALARRIVATLREPVRLAGEEIYLSASVGVISDDGARTASQLLADADAAMYHAKTQGGARYSTRDGLAPTDELLLGNDLHRALVQEQMRSRYQPVIDLGTGDVVAAEALMRWQHPSRGELAPGAFLDLAHQLGLITDLDTWMLARACVDAAQWHREVGRPVAVWVNLSGRTLADPRLHRTVGAVLDRAGLAPEALTLEITEGALMANARSTAAALGRLEQLGVQLAVDDFGTGYSSLAYLQQFPVHALKVDRSFVDRLDKEPRRAEASSAIVRAVVNLATALGLRTIAEGIETPQQLAAVTELGCDGGQGYWLGRPAAQHQVTTAIRTGVTIPSSRT